MKILGKSRPQYLKIGWYQLLSSNWDVVKPLEPTEFWVKWINPNLVTVFRWERHKSVSWVHTAIFTSFSCFRCWKALSVIVDCLHLINVRLLRYLKCENAPLSMLCWYQLSIPNSNKLGKWLKPVLLIFSEQSSRNNLVRFLNGRNASSVNPMQSCNSRFTSRVKAANARSVVNRGCPIRANWRTPCKYWKDRRHVVG